VVAVVAVVAVAMVAVLGALRGATHILLKPWDAMDLRLGS
jgi:hypothetical protein